MSALKSQLGLSWLNQPVKNISELTKALREQKRKKNFQKELFFGEISFKKNQSKYLWIFRSQGSNSGVYGIVDSQLHLIYVNDTSGAFLEARAQDLFRIGELNLLITYHLWDRSKDWNITEILRLKSPKEIELMYRYSPKNVTQLDYFSSSQNPGWKRGKLHCESQLEWRKKSNQHEPDLSLVVRGQVELDQKSLSTDEVKALNAQLKKRLGITLGQPITAIMDRISFDGDEPDNFITYGVKYGDDPVQFGKSPCPGPWLKSTQLPQMTQGGP